MTKRGVVKNAVVSLAAVLILIGLLQVDPARADTAEVLPKGIFGASVTGTFYMNQDEWYDQDGNIEDPAADFNGELILGEALGMPINIGRSVVEFDWDQTKVEATLAYGITDKLMVGVLVPYWSIKNRVKAELDTTNATFGKNPAWESGADPFGSPIIPIALGGVPLTTEDALDFVSGGTDINGNGTIDLPGLGFERFESWSERGVGDIELALIYQYFKSEDWTMAGKLGVTFPTGFSEDTDNLQDWGVGGDFYGILTELYTDYRASQKLGFNLTLEYAMGLPFDKDMRVPEDSDAPLTGVVKEKVDINPGNYFSAELTGSYTIIKGLNLSLSYKYGYKGRDEVEGDLNLEYDALEDESDYHERLYKVGISYSTIPLFLEKKYPVPFTISTTYRKRLEGQNLFDSTYIEVAAALYF